ncbi:MAG: GNAT family N-acetyltransferase [Devosia sp.]
MHTRPAGTTLDIRPMLPGDVPAAMGLVRAAGWNQTEADWRFMLAAGQGFGIAGDSGRLLASSVVLSYPPDVGWIGMVLVAPEARRQGLATRLMHNAVAATQGAGLVPMLDATPAGREVYDALGFRDLEGIGRWRGIGRGQAAAALRMSPAQARAGIAADAVAFGADRRRLLSELRGRAGGFTLALPDGGGWLWSRAGRTATQVGPILASSAAGAITLCAAALDQLAGPILIDVPEREAELTAFLRGRGFSLERQLTRMALGGAAPATLGSAMRAIAGPELG